MVVFLLLDDYHQALGMLLERCRRQCHLLLRVRFASCLRVRNTRCVACFKETGTTAMLYHLALVISSLRRGGDNQLPVASTSTQVFVSNNEGSTRDQLWPRSS
jgi:hypothetical protein